jgi:hypothetical protein
MVALIGIELFFGLTPPAAHLYLILASDIGLLAGSGWTGLCKPLSL